jgi:hypothetical protein
MGRKGLSLGGVGAVVDVEEFEGLEDRLYFAFGAEAFFAFGGDGRSRNDVEWIAMGLFEGFRGDRAVRKFKTALRTPQHPTGMSPPIPGLRSDDIGGRKDARVRGEFNLIEWLRAEREEKTDSSRRSG